MDAKKRAKLEAAGFRFGDAEDFLELTAEERAEVDRRLRSLDREKPDAAKPQAAHPPAR